MHHCRSRRTAVAIVALLVALGTLPRTAAAQKPVPALDTVTAVASRTALGEAARDVEIITRADIDNSSARTIADVLAERMDVDVNPRSEAQADVSIRGTTAEQTLILVDGVRVSDVQTAHYNLDLAVPLASVERIEILRGAASAVYGPDAVGGVINIVTRHSAAPLEAAVHGGEVGTIGASGSATSGRTTSTAPTTRRSAPGPPRRTPTGRCRRARGRSP